LRICSSVAGSARQDTSLFVDYKEKTGNFLKKNAWRREVFVKLLQSRLYNGRLILEREYSVSNLYQGIQP
jgi:hypothetical protein